MRGGRGWQEGLVMGGGVRNRNDFLVGAKDEPSSGGDSAECETETISLLGARAGHEDLG